MIFELAVSFLAAFLVTLIDNSLNFITKMYHQLLLLTLLLSTTLLLLAVHFSVPCVLYFSSQKSMDHTFLHTCNCFISKLLHDSDLFDFFRPADSCFRQLIPRSVRGWASCGKCSVHFV